MFLLCSEYKSYTSMNEYGVCLHLLVLCSIYFFNMLLFLLHKSFTSLGRVISRCCCWCCFETIAKSSTALVSFIVFIHWKDQNFCVLLGLRYPLVVDISWWSLTVFIKCDYLFSFLFWVRHIEFLSIKKDSCLCSCCDGLHKVEVYFCIPRLSRKFS